MVSLIRRGIVVAILLTNVVSLTPSEKLFRVLSTRTAKISHINRRAILGGLVSLAILPYPASAARGAAELDAEFYLRDLVGGNRQEGSILASAPPKPKPPRTLKGPWIGKVLTTNYTEDCIVVLSLVAQASKGVGSMNLAASVHDKAIRLRSRSEKSFYAKAPWSIEDAKDQYYFDISCYALWKVAAEMLSDYRERDAFVRRLGRAVYQEILRSGAIKAPPSDKKASLSLTLDSLQSLMNAFEDSGFCKGYRLGGDAVGDAVFDQIDDEALQDGASVDFLVSVYEPATLSASLQITGEQSRFSPDLVGPTLAALLESIGVRATWETFFVDQTYRPNPKDYFPDEQLLQFTLTLA